MDVFTKQIQKLKAEFTSTKGKIQENLNRIDPHLIQQGNIELRMSIMDVRISTHDELLTSYQKMLEELTTQIEALEKHKTEILDSYTHSKKQFDEKVSGFLLQLKEDKIKLEVELGKENKVKEGFKVRKLRIAEFISGIQLLFDSQKELSGIPIFQKKKLDVSDPQGGDQGGIVFPNDDVKRLFEGVDFSG